MWRADSRQVTEAWVPLCWLYLQDPLLLCPEAIVFVPIFTTPQLSQAPIVPLLQTKAHAAFDLRG